MKESLTQNTTTVFFHIRMFIKGAISTRMTRKFLSESYVEAVCKGRNFTIFQWSSAILERSVTNFRSTKNLARQVFCCTATSAPSGRVFSIAGNYFTANRAQLGTDSFRSMLLIKCNSELFEKLPTFSVHFFLVSFCFSLTPIKLYFFFLSPYFWEIKATITMIQQNIIIIFLFC